MTAALRTKLDNTPMAPYLKLMRNMNREQKLAVLAYIVDTLQNDENEDKNETSDEVYIKELLALRYDGALPANEMKKIIRESHNFGGRDIKLPCYGE
ncbi:MAG: hypothetical protein J6T70_12770 [Bacteroidales bacterium]|nr:hypothetical protein [Bacteroidales bacterium]MBP5367378.1 hypothetical protein [Bacteroidales bacterium]